MSQEHATICMSLIFPQDSVILTYGRHLISLLHVGTAINVPLRHAKTCAVTPVASCPNQQLGVLATMSKFDHKQPTQILARAKTQ